MTILSTYYSDQRVDSSGLRQKLYALLTILATVTLSPTTVDFLTAAFFRLNIPVGTYMFFGFIGLTALMVVGGFVNRTGFSYATTLFIICLSLAATSLWSPSSNYLATKLPLVIITPTILFLSGFMIAAAGRTTDLGMSVVGFGLVILLGIWIFGEDTIVGFQVGLTDEFGGRYQSISRVLAVSVITCFTFSVTDTVRWRQTLLLAVGSLLAFQILYSGGRVGFLILVITMPILIASLLRGRHMVLVLLLWMVLMALFSYILDLRALAEMIWPTQMPLTIDRILMEFSNNSVTQFEAMQRSNLWLTAIDLWRENPLLGVGLAGFPLHAGFGDRKSTRLNSSHRNTSRMPSSA